jgi:hypothetical protein
MLGRRSKVVQTDAPRVNAARSAAQRVAYTTVNKASSLSDIVAAGTLTVVFITAWLYEIGWCYAVHYLDSFHIPLLAVDFPLQHLLVYGGLAVLDVLWIAVPLFACVYLLALGCYRHTARIGRFGIMSITMFTMIALFAIGNWVGKTAAEDDFIDERNSDYRAYPRVELIAKKDIKDELENRFGDVLKKDCGRLILAASGRLFLIRPVRGASAANLDTFVIPADQLIAMRIEDEYHSCTSLAE